MTNPKGEITMQAGGKAYRLHLGMSGLGDLQERFGEKFDAVLEGAMDGKLPSLKMVHAIIATALERHHGEDVKSGAARWIADDIMAENPDALPALLRAAFPDVEDGEPKKAKAAA